MRKPLALIPLACSRCGRIFSAHAEVMNRDERDNAVCGFCQPTASPARGRPPGRYGEAA